MSWADQFNTHDEACIYYGCDTSSQLQAEMEDDSYRAAVEEQDDLEARGAAGPGSYGLTEALRRAEWYNYIPF